MHTIEQLRQWCQGKYLQNANEKQQITELTTDSRNISHPEMAVFIAIKTAVRNGHTYINIAYAAGVRCFLVQEAIELSGLEGATVVQVKDTLVALQHIAAAHRRVFTYPVVGITGSNGKTIVKEWLYQLLGGYYNIVRSPKSYNSQSGVPLSVWLMNSEHTLGIFEAGISQAGEMEKLEKVMRPDIGVFTNIGEAHSEGFVNARQKINEKLVLFSHVSALVYCRDHADVNDAVVAFRNHRGGDTSGLRLFTWSVRGGADLHITHIAREHGHTEITGVHNNEATTIRIPFTDAASVENAIHCLCVCLLLQVPIAKITAKMPLLQQVSMRLELRHGANECTLINDAYNSDITSLQVALGYLEQQVQHQRRTVILSDILQVGKSDADLYEEVAALISKRSIQRFIGIGAALFRYKMIFEQYEGLETHFFKDTPDFLKHFFTLTFSHEAILLKGARVFAFERIAKLLERQIHQTVLSIDLAALRSNLDVYRAAIRPGVKTMAMVKAFAYGSGGFEIASVLQRSGVDYLTVAYTEEGIALRRAGITVPIMVMSPDASSFDRMIAWQLEPEIYSFRSLGAFEEVAAALLATQYPVHIKLDTGMHRLGFGVTDIPALKARLSGNSSINVASIFSHLASSTDPADDDFTAAQAALFDTMSTELMQVLPQRPYRHLCNSAAIKRHPGLHYDMVRLGVGLYGIDAGGTLREKLKQVGTLTTTIAQIRTVAAGERVGYGHDTILEKEMRIATISIGYADGYMRSLKNGQPYVMVHNKKATIVGAICMDMCMVDVSNIAEASEGDEVLVFGKELPVTLLASWAGTISYEIMAGISQRVKRVYINEE